MFALEKHLLVDCDLEEAALWYAARGAGVAERFIAAAEETLRDVGMEPLKYRERFENVRRANLAGFPYGIFYCVQDSTVFVLAVLHAARDHRAALQRRPSAE
jgi:plasmid stabilization system protein ParE